MKTIKELEKADNEEFCDEYGYLQALKDVIKLIDKMPKVNHFGGKSGSVYKCVLVKELKARIEG